MVDKAAEAVATALPNGVPLRQAGVCLDVLPPPAPLTAAVPHLAAIGGHAAGAIDPVSLPYRGLTARRAQPAGGGQQKDVPVPPSRCTIEPVAGRVFVRGKALALALRAARRYRRGALPASTPVFSGAEGTRHWRARARASEVAPAVPADPAEGE